LRRQLNIHQNKVSNEENALLRQQLIVLNRHVKRPQLTRPDLCWLLSSSAQICEGKQIVSGNKMGESSEAVPQPVQEPYRKIIRSLMFFSDSNPIFICLVAKI